MIKLLCTTSRRSRTSYTYETIVLPWRWFANFQNKNSLKYIYAVNIGSVKRMDYWENGAIVLII